MNDKSFFTVLIICIVAAVVIYEEKKLLSGSIFCSISNTLWSVYSNGVCATCIKMFCSWNRLPPGSAHLKWWLTSHISSSWMRFGFWRVNKSHFRGLLTLRGCNGGPRAADAVSHAACATTERTVIVAALDRAVCWGGEGHWGEEPGCYRRRGREVCASLREKCKIEFCHF